MDKRVVVNCSWFRFELKAYLDNKEVWSAFQVNKVRFGAELVKSFYCVSGQSTNYEEVEKKAWKDLSAQATTYVKANSLNSKDVTYTKSILQVGSVQTDFS